MHRILCTSDEVNVLVTGSFPRPLHEGLGADVGTRIEFFYRNQGYNFYKILQSFLENTRKIWSSSIESKLIFYRSCLIYGFED